MNKALENSVNRKNGLEMLFFFVLGFFFHWYLKSDVIITNSDDLRSLHRGFFTLNSNFSDLYYPFELARIQGRFYFILSDFFSYLPYFFEGRLIRSGFIAFVYCLSGLSISYILYKFTSNSFFTKAFFILYLLCIPIYPSWYAYYHWPLYWFLPVIFFSIALFVWTIFNRKNLSTAKKIILYFLYLIFTLLAILFSEMYFLVFGTILALLFLKQIYENNKIKQIYSTKIFSVILKSWASFIRDFLPYFIYLGIYVVYKLFFANPINRVSEKLAFNFNFYDIFISIKNFFITAFPLNIINFKQSTQFVSSISAITVEEIFIIFLVIVFSFYVSNYFIKLFGHKLTNKKQGNSSIDYPIYLKFLITFVLGYLFVSIHVLTGFYQNWLANFRPWYTPTFHLSVSLLIIFVFLLDHAYKNTISKSKISKFNIIIIFFISAIVTINTLSSFSVRSILVERNVVWHFMYKIKNTKLNSELKINDSLLFAELPFSISPSRSELLSTFLDKNLTVYPDIHEKILKYNWEIKIFHTQDHKSSYLVAGKPINKDSDKNQFKKIWVIPYNTTKSLKISLYNKECKFWKNKEVFQIESDTLFKLSDVVVSNARLNKHLTICHRVSK